MIFVDSSVLIAAAIVGDRWHQNGKEIIQKLIEKKQPVYITALILSETITAIGHALGGKAAQRVYFNLVDNPQVHIATQEKRELNDIFALYLKFDGTIGFSDSASIYTMYENNIKTIASFDSDFDKVGNISRLEEL